MSDRTTRPAVDETERPELIESEHWHSLLSGEDPAMRRLRGMWRRVPAALPV